MNSPSKIPAFLLIFAAQLIALGTTGCSGDGSSAMPASSARTYHLAVGWGIQLTVAIDEQKSLSIDYVDASVSPAVSRHVAGTCSDADTAFGVQPCTVSGSNDTEFPPGTELKFKEVPEVMLVMGRKKPTDSFPTAPADVLQNVSFFWEINPSCGAVNDDFGTLGLTNPITYGVDRIDLGGAFMRHSDFNFTPAGASFTSKYVTSIASGGQDNIISTKCDSGLWTFKVQDGGGVIAEHHALLTPSGLLVTTQRGFHAPKSLAITNLDQLASVQLAGAVLPVSGNDQVDPIQIGLGSRSANLVNAASYSSASGIPTFQGLSLLLAADPANGTRFSAATDSSNALSMNYATAASTPALLYSPQKDGAANEVPTLSVAFRSAITGKVILIGMSSTRSGSDFYMKNFVVLREP